MIPLSYAASGTFTLSRIKRGFELRRNGESLGSLVRPSFWAQNYIASTPTAACALRRTSCFSNRAEAVDSTTQKIVASFSATWGGPGTVTFADGQTFRLRRQGWWRPVWTVLTEGDQMVLQVRQWEGKVEVANAAGVPEDRVALLALFTLYRIRQAEDDAAAVAVMAAS